jgi:hypothetical protein
MREVRDIQNLITWQNANDLLLNQLINEGVLDRLQGLLKNARYNEIVDETFKKLELKRLENE